MKYELKQGDCLEILKQIPDGSIDMILADPPYGTTACKWDIVIPFEPMWKELKRVIKPNGAIVLFGSEPFSSHLRLSNIKDYKYDWVWEKSKASNFLLAKINPLKCHEIISVFNSKVYFPQMTKGKPYKNKAGVESHAEWSINSKSAENKTGDRYPRSVQYFATSENEKGKRKHPTQKPVALLEYLIKTYTHENETVLDFTMGSGSTGVACINTNRNFIGIELDEHYFNVAKQRIEQILDEKK